MPSWLTVALRAALVGLFVALLAAQVLVLPPGALVLAHADPAVGPVVWALLVVAELVLVCVQIALVCTWVLLGLVERELIFSSGRVLSWVDGIVAAGAAATVLVGGAIWLSLDRGAVPGLVAGLAAVAVFGVGFTLLLVVMRGLLRQAVQLHDDLAEVI